ncbi:MAG: pyridoxal-phosphate dependent enzyme, partial [Chloroflexota bacterium]|nr:pyridoxal-phosphate dependent enzyme [Chloroflexota bacterium]
MQYLPSYLAATGNTPLIAMPTLTRGLKPLVLAKAEQLNPGGSVKDRIGAALIEQGEREGKLRPGGTIIEPTSGNTGVGLAITAASKGYKLIFTMPDKVAVEKRALLQAYGAEIIVCPTNVPRESAESYYSVANRLERELSNAYQPNQYFNPANPHAHYVTTGPEIWEQTDGRVTHLVASVGTGGTITGTGRYLKEQNPDIVIVGADPEGSIYTQPERMHGYLTEGIGEDFWPGTFDPSVVDRWVTVSDRDAYSIARRIAREEGMLVGSSTGTAMHGALTVAPELGEEAVVVVIFCDTGRNYISKLYNVEWLREHDLLDED